MAQRQQAADVHPDELCPPNKRYDFMDANKKVDLENFWHTLKEDGSKNRLKFLLDRKELTLTLDDFITIFHLLQANDNNHASFVPPPSFSDMVPFYKKVLGFTMELKFVSNFKIHGLLQLWQTLCKIFSKCLTTRVTGWDQPPLQIMKMLYYFVNNIHVYYAELMRARDAYHNLQDDDIMKNIFNSGRNKNKVRMRIPAWMITDKMKLTENYKMYAEVFGLDVPLTHSQLTESTQGTHRITSAPRSPNPDTEPAKSMPTAEKAVEMILQDTIQVSLAEHKSHEEQEARENVALVDEHLAVEEIEKLVENPENVDDSSPSRHDDTSIPGTRLEPRSDKESPEVEIIQEKEEEARKATEVEPDIVIPVNVDDEEEEITDEVFKLRRRAKGHNVEESRISTIPSPTRSPRNFSTLVSLDTEKLQELTVTHPRPSSGNQEQDDEFDFWTDSYASDDDEIPTNQVSQDIMEEISLTINEAKLKKMMKNFLQSDIVWESKKEILVYLHPRKITSLVQSCQRDPEAPALSLINQDLLYLKKGNFGPGKIILSLHKFPVIVFNDDDIEERTSRWVNKCIKKFNPYARYGVENWKNPHAKIFYIRRQKEPGRPKEEIYSNSKIVQPDYKNLNENDIEDMYLLIMNNKVPDYANTGLLWSLLVFIRSSVIWERVHDFQLGIESYQQKINLTAPTITFPGIEEYDVYSIVYEPVHGIIYTNSKKEKRVMRPSEIHKFCDATLRRTLEGLKSYYNDVKYGYVQKELTNDEVEFLKLFKEEIEV
ncbi:hypothetical protein Tco_0532922 [Tanacetum coccineum]